MFCGKCGVENDEGASFCKGCGAELVSAQALEAYSNSSVSNGASNGFEGISVPPAIKDKVAGRFKKIFKGVLIGAAVLFLLFILIGVYVMIGPTINLNKYVEVETEGYDGYGHAKVSLDWDKIETDYGWISCKDKARESYGGFVDAMSPVEILRDYISVKADQEDKLSNGTEITYEWDVDEKLSDYLHCRVKYKSDTYKVEGLTQIDKFNPFDSLSVSFKGQSPNGKIDYFYEGSDLSDWDFECDKKNGLKNGDKVTVSIHDVNMENYASAYGKIPEITEMEYEVSGLEEYVDKYADLSEEFLNKVKKEAEDTVLAYTARGYNDSSSVSDLAYAGYIFNVLKENDGFNHYNYLYIVYEGTVSNSEDGFETTKVYFPVRFTDILSGSEGQKYSSDPSIEGYSRFEDSWYSTKGYIDGTKMYSELVTESRDKYTYEVSDAFAQFGN